MLTFPDIFAELISFSLPDRDLGMPKTVALYARVSTRGQELENQLAALTSACARNDWHVVRVFTDYGISGAKGRGARKGLDDLLKAVVRREIDQVCVWSIDRLGRSLRDLINVLDELQQKGCDLYVHKQAIDTNTPSGKMLFQMLASLPSSNARSFANASLRANNALALKANGSADGA